MAVPPSTKNIVIGVVVSLVVLMAICGRSVDSVNNAGPGSQPAKNTAMTPTKPAAPPPRSELPKVDAVRLWRDYEANEVAADNRYKHVRMVVSGVVQSIDKDFLDNLILHLRSPNMFMSTMAKLKDSQKEAAASLAKGEHVDLECTCDGRLMGSPTLSDCIVR